MSSMSRAECAVTLSGEEVAIKVRLLIGLDAVGRGPQDGIAPGLAGHDAGLAWSWRGSGRPANYERF